MFTLTCSDRMKFTLIHEGERYVVLNLSEAASDAALDTLASMMDGGRIELLAADDGLVAVLKLSNPVAPPAADGAIEFDPITPGAAVKAGRVDTARIVAANGAEVFLCDVGTMDSDAVIKLDTTSISRGDQVRIGSFTLSMP